MPKFRKQPVVIDAEQFTAPENPEGAMFMHWPVQKDEKGCYLIIPTLEGDHRANEGDWIIQGVKGEFYPVKPDIFEATYISHTAPEGVGATGNFPDGKLDESDEGEIAFAIGADKDNNAVMIHFGKPVAWLGLAPEKASELGRSLIAKALELTA